MRIITLVPKWIWWQIRLINHTYIHTVSGGVRDVWRGGGESRTNTKCIFAPRVCWYIKSRHRFGKIENVTREIRVLSARAVRRWRKGFRHCIREFNLYNFHAYTYLYVYVGHMIVLSRREKEIGLWMRDARCVIYCGFTAQRLGLCLKLNSCANRLLDAFDLRFNLFDLSAYINLTGWSLLLR